MPEKEVFETILNILLVSNLFYTIVSVAVWLVLSRLFLEETSTFGDVAMFVSAVTSGMVLVLLLFLQVDLMNIVLDFHHQMATIDSFQELNTYYIPIAILLFVSVCALMAVLWDCYAEKDE